MPRISVVVPAYQVADFLPECLNSILQQSFTNIEVIVVNDCSPDTSGHIANAYAIRDHRVRVAHLPHNIGLGPARGVGFHLAASDYVWFVDSDDRLGGGALAAVAARVDSAAPDMLIVDYHRDSWSSLDTRSRLEENLPAASTPLVFTATKQPCVFTLLHTAWARVLRRDLIIRSGRPFHNGWYEDVSFTFPMLVAAQRISALHYLCYHYRDGRKGAITATPSQDHFQVFDQYERLYDTLARWGIDKTDGPWLHIFERMLWHYRWILNSSTRIPAELERGFFGRMSEHFTRYQPADLTRPSNIEGVKRALIAHDSWHLFAALRYAHRLAEQARGRLSPKLAAGSVG